MTHSGSWMRSQDGSDGGCGGKSEWPEPRCLLCWFLTQTVLFMKIVFGRHKCVNYKFQVD